MFKIGSAAQSGVAVLALLVAGCTNASDRRRDAPAGPAKVAASVPLEWSPGALAVDAAGRRIYIGGSRIRENESLGGALLVVDARTRKTLATLNVPPNTAGVAFDAKRSRVYVLTQGEGDDPAALVRAFDAGDHRTLWSTRLNGAPGGFVLNAEAGRVYASLADAGTQRATLSVLDTGSGATVGAIHLGRAIEATRGIAFGVGRVYVGLNAPDAPGGSVAVVDLARREVVTSIPVQSPEGIATDERNGRVYVTDTFPGAVRIIDPGTNRIVSSIATKSRPSGIVIDPTRGRAYVINGGTEGTDDPTKVPNPDTVGVIDLESGRMIASVRVALMPHAIALDLESGDVYVGSIGLEGQEGTLTILS